MQGNSIGANGTTTSTYTGPTSTQAEKAVAFAYAQLGKPYQWGATGPGSYDCSGLVQAAWAAAGNGYIIDAPQTGMDVQKIPMNNGWYAATYVGAARP